MRCSLSRYRHRLVGLFDLAIGRLTRKIIFWSVWSSIRRKWDRQATQAAIGNGIGNISPRRLTQRHDADQSHPLFKAFLCAVPDSATRQPRGQDISNRAFGHATGDHADFGRLFASNHQQQSRRSLFHHNIRIQGMTKRQRWHAVAAAGLFLATPSLAEVAPSFPKIPGGISRGLDAAASPVIRIANEIDEVKPDIDLYALMSGQCRTLRVAGRDFACKAVAYFHSEKGRANFTIALDDPADASHVISFSGENSRRPQQNLYELSVDRMLLSSRDRPKADGLPVPSVEVSAGVCRQIGNFATRQVSSIVCSATDKTGRSYHLQFESDGSPITLRRIRQSTPTIRQDPYR